MDNAHVDTCAKGKQASMYQWHVNTELRYLLKSVTFTFRYSDNLGVLNLELGLKRLASVTTGG